MSSACCPDIEEGTKRLQYGRCRRWHTMHGRWAERYPPFFERAFNIMRGGVLPITTRLRELIFTCKSKIRCCMNCCFFANSGALFSIFALRSVAAGSGNPDFIRLNEYLRLHSVAATAIPASPGTSFSINTRNETGDPVVLDHQGNWRDIFQNWEALAHAYPGFIEGMIYKFLNASTFDGYNPYRVSKDGFDWEIINPIIPGRTQVIGATTRLFTCSNSSKNSPNSGKPGIIDRWLPICISCMRMCRTGSNPTRRSYGTPKTQSASTRNWITACGNASQPWGRWRFAYQKRTEIYTGLVYGEDTGRCCLSKLSNFIPEAGIWMNTNGRNGMMPTTHSWAMAFPW